VEKSLAEKYYKKVEDLTKEIEKKLRKKRTDLATFRKIQARSLMTRKNTIKTGMAKYLNTLRNGWEADIGPIDNFIQHYAKMKDDPKIGSFIRTHLGSVIKDIYTPKLEFLKDRVEFTDQELQAPASLLKEVNESIEHEKKEMAGGILGIILREGRNGVKKMGKN